MRQVANYYSRIPHGQIPEASHTYHAIGNINELKLLLSKSLDEEKEPGEQPDAAAKKDAEQAE